MAEKKTFKNPRIRVPRKIKKDQLIEVRVKVNHNSYTGLAFENDNYVSKKPAYYLKRMEVRYGEELVCAYDMSAATSPNPLIRFNLIATKEAPLKVLFTNSENVTKEAATKVKFV